MHLAFSSMNTRRDPPPRQLAQALEERGFESLWYGEHSHIPCSLQSPYPGGGVMPDPYKMMMDPYLSLVEAASVTSRLRLGTGVALLMERELFSLAKTIATLDVLTGGRVLIGTGVGWNREAFENSTDKPWNKRYAVLRETVEALRTLWRDPAPEFHGDYVDFEPVWHEPKPLQAGGPRILFGAMGPTGLRHAAEWADGWMPVDLALDDVGKAVSSFRTMVRANGRDPGSVEISLQAMTNPTLDTLKRYRDLGIYRVTVGVAVDLWDKPERVMPTIDHFARFIPELAG